MTLRTTFSQASVFRLNIGVSKQTFQSLFGPRSAASDEPAPSAAGGAEEGYDFTALNQIMPHPAYGNMYWVCVLNSLLKKGTVSFQRVIFPRQIDTAERDCPLFQRAVNTSEATFKKVEELLAEAYAMAVRKRARKTPADEAGAVGCVNRFRADAPAHAPACPYRVAEAGPFGKPRR